ncbi:HNH endonuclease [Paenibacillus wenxiniae]|uniref:HNH endonuclease n=1 Tax=Paenibacillus wenxiniae TaxID=1636843 RepID=A0ABW4RGJ9_9BACL
MYHDPMSRQQSKSPSTHMPVVQQQPDQTKTTISSTSRHILQLSSQLGNQQLGKWLARQANSVASYTTPVIQRARFLSKDDAGSIEEAIQITLSGMEDDIRNHRGVNIQQYKDLYSIYNNFDAGSLATATIEGIRKLTKGSKYSRLKDLDAWMESLITGNVRSSNYPSSYSSTAQQAFDTYKTNYEHPFNTNQCRCSSCRRYVNKSDMTIDHIESVAAHWNRIGRNTDRTTRHNWYSYTGNHAYCCRACNSSMGSGGIRYKMTVGRNYSG